MRWEDLPIDGCIIFVSHEWVGWNHPDPHGIQLKTFLSVMKRLRLGEIPQVEMNWYVSLHFNSPSFIYDTHKHTHTVITGITI